MRLSIHLFAGLSEQLNNSQIEIITNEETVTAFRLKQLIAEQYPQAEAIIQHAFVARNHTYAAEDTLLHEQDELALIPPVSGG